MERYTHEVDIDKMVFGGAALTRVDGKAHFVEGALPKENVIAVFDRKKGGVPFGFVEKIITPSNKRRVPNCKYYGECGGCDWLHINYEEQLIYKRQIFSEQLNRVGKIATFPEIETISGEEFGYRSRAQLKVDVSKKKMGFFRKNTNEIIDIETCLLLDKKINNLLAKKTDILNLIKKEKQIKIISTEDDLVTYPELKNYSSYSGVVKMDGLKFNVNGRSFFQSNKYLISQMGKHLAEMAKGETFIDMYGGVGFFSLYIAKNFTHGLLVETDQKMVKAAENNFAENNITNVDAMVVSAESFFDLKDIAVPDYLIVDPPRHGLTRSVRDGVANLGAKKIIYVSCDPSTQARDIGFFVKDFGYKISKLLLFDLYPNTYHMETIILLGK